MAPIERKCQFGNGKAWKTAVCFGRVIIRQNVHEVAKRCYMAHIVNMDVNSPDWTTMGIHKMPPK